MKYLKSSIIAFTMLLSLCMVSIAADTVSVVKDTSAASNVSAEWIVSESAYIDGSKIVITPEDYGTLGMAWYKKDVDLTQNFDLLYKIYLGTQDEEGADGIVFVLASELAETSPGQDLGYTGIAPSFAVEIDTHPNDGEHVGDDLGDPLDDHISINYGGTANHYELETQPVEVGNLEDGKEHSLRITWDATGKIFNVFLNDAKAPQISYTGDIVENFLAGKSKVKMGFTGSTGMFMNLQYVIPVKLTFGITPKPVDSGWTLMGDAKWDAKKIVITPDEGSMVGAAWYNPPIDLSKELELNFKIYLGDKDDEGADGIVFVLASEKTAAELGEGLGYQGIENSFAIEIDTYPNDGEHIGGDQGDPLLDHLAVDLNGSVDHTGSSLPIAQIGNIEDGKEHDLRIKWDPKSKTVSVYIDDMRSPRMKYTADISKKYFDGKKDVRMGFTGSTGFFCNLQYIIPMF